MFLEMFVRCAVPQGKVGASFIHVQRARCQDIFHVSHHSVKLVSVKYSVSISLVKHYSQATSGAERGRDGNQ